MADAEIDRLFTLPLGEFTAARNALAKTAGPGAAAIRALAKPSVAAWAVNQLYWQDRPRYDALVAAARDMRRAHTAVLEGKRADLRAAGREHEHALDAAQQSALAQLARVGHPATEQTRQQIANTLRALPSSAHPGRLTQALAPGGFEMLAGIAPSARPAGARGPAPAPAKPAARQGRTAANGRRDANGARGAKAAREAARLEERRAAAERAIRDADQAARHAEFEAARAARTAAKAAQRVDEARTALDKARADLEAAEKDEGIASRARQTAERRARDAQAALDAARARRLT